jgi:hypothetical protein
MLEQQTLALLRIHHWPLRKSFRGLMIQPATRSDCTGAPAQLPI